VTISHNETKNGSLLGIYLKNNWNCAYSVYYMTPKIRNDIIRRTFKSLKL